MCLGGRQWLPLLFGLQEGSVPRVIELLIQKLKRSGLWYEINKYTYNGKLKVISKGPYVGLFQGKRAVEGLKCFLYILQKCSTKGVHLGIMVTVHL